MIQGFLLDFEQDRADSMFSFCFAARLKADYN